jgi:hypothetical protein
VHLFDKKIIKINLNNKNMKKSILCITGVIMLVILHSCNITVAGLCSGYSRLSDEHKKQIVFLDTKDNVCELEKDGKIYAITGDQLHTCLETQENAMVYSWVPHCTSSSCYLLSYVQSYCDSHGFTLYVIASYYDTTRMFVEQNNISLPLFSPNEKYYKTKYRNRYTKLFMKDLIKDEKLVKEIWYKNMLIFNYGKLTTYSLKLEDDTTDNSDAIKLWNEIK